MPRQTAIFKRNFFYTIFLLIVFISKEERQAMREQKIKETQENFKWWPTDAKPAPLKDPEKGGYWWWPATPAETKPWGNRGTSMFIK